MSTSRTIYVKKVASLVAEIISTYLVVGNIVHLMTKHLTIDINSAESWFSHIKLSESSVEEFTFWKENIGHVNIKPFSTDESCHKVVYSDASNCGYGDSV